MIRLLAIVMLLACLGCSTRQHTDSPAGPSASEVSRFHRLDLTTGMERQKVEEEIASLLSRPQQYSPYGKNLSGGVVPYRDGVWLLEVTYKAGAPAPWVENADGSVQHLPPIDEAVLEYKITRIPNQASEDIDAGASNPQR